jgi:hypothetical protein
MADFANDKLNVELYTLSGWETPKNEWFMLPGEGDEFGSFREIPRYSLGYLLRKLPKLIALPDNGTGGFLFIDIKKYKSGIRWRAGYHDQMLVNADTPEDAVCSLAIELFKQGILTNKP